MTIYFYNRKFFETEEVLQGENINTWDIHYEKKGLFQDQNGKIICFIFLFPNVYDNSFYFF